MKNGIEDLRNHLFAQLERLSDEDITGDQAKLAQELERAKAVADIGRVIVDSAKAETAFIAATGATEGTGFIALPEGAVPPRRPQLAAGARR